MLIKVFIILFIGFSTIANSQVIYFNKYVSKTKSYNIATVILFTQDSVMTYVYEVGYIWWKIKNIDYINYDHLGRINSAQVNLTRYNNYLLLKVDDKMAVQVIRLQPENIVFTIETIRNIKLNK